MQSNIFNVENVSKEARYRALEEIRISCAKCYKCDLSQTRNNVVFGEGSFNSNIMLIGEGPGQQEDESGKPFVGRAGQMLDKILETQDICRNKNIYICNIVKCRPPENRAPKNEEISACKVYLEAQILLMQPKIIILCGSTAVKALLGIKSGISKIRGQWFDGSNGSKIMPIFHPSYLLRYQSNEPGSPKYLTLQDIKEIKRLNDTL